MVPSLIYLDRYRNGGTRVYSRHAAYTEAFDPYRPDSEHPGFEVPTFEVPRSDLNVYRASPSGPLEAKYLPGDQALLCIHPQVISSFPGDPYVRRTLEVGSPADPLFVSPSSSTRTLCVLDPVSEDWSDPPHSVKVHFPFRVSRYGRKMRDEVVEQAIAVSAELEEGLAGMEEVLAEMEGVLTEGEEGSGSFAFLREVLGVTHKNLEPNSPRGENWGYLVREMTPFPANTQFLQPASSSSLVPGFALYGRDYFDSASPPLVEDLLCGRNPETFILEKVLIPIIRHWVACFLTFGFVLEPHGQNVLLEVDGYGDIRRMAHRDMSVAIDMRRRRDLGRDDEALNDYNRMEGGEFNSIAYDKFLGGHFFDRLLETVLDGHSHLTLEDFRAPCREEFARIFPDHRRYLPTTVQYFSEERDQFGKPRFIDTGEAPVWRP